MVPGAAPIAAAMNGPVHGVATNAASSPVANAPHISFLGREPPLAKPGMESSNAPSRLAVIATVSNASAATTPGSCSWKAQPISLPAARRANNAPPRIRQAAITPAL